MSGEGRRRFRATVHYDGSEFHGWQIQPSERTVQGELEAALGDLLQREVRTEAAGRTDRGVHAVAQEVAFPAAEGWSPDEMRRALNGTTPDEVWVERVAWAPDDFHPRFDATARRYAYLLGVREDAASPVRRGRVWQLCRTPDRDLLAELAAELTGRRDFSGFAKAGQPERGTECEVSVASWDESSSGDLVFQVVADRFLHHMVRYMVATLTEVALGERPREGFRALLDGRDASAAEGPRPPRPAPAQGLYLTGVRYPEGWNRDGSVPGLVGAGAAVGGEA